MAVAGETNEAVGSVWGTVLRSFSQVDGHRRLHDLAAMLKPVVVDGQNRWRIYPAESERVLRVVRKVVRGLSHYHNIETAVSDTRVWADVLKLQLPAWVMDEVTFEHREADVCQWWYDVSADDEVASRWVIKFYERRVFIAVVNREAHA